MSSNSRRSFFADETLCRWELNRRKAWTGSVTSSLRPARRLSSSISSRHMRARLPCLVSSWNRFIDRSFVMTCADPMLAVKATPWLSGHNIFQKPYAMADIADTVCSLIRLHSPTTSSIRYVISRDSVRAR